MSGATFHLCTRCGAVTDLHDHRCRVCETQAAIAASRAAEHPAGRAAASPAQLRARRSWRALRWRGWRLELTGVVTAVLVLFVVDARWWWKAALLLGLSFVWGFVFSLSASIATIRRGRYTDGRP
jgi:hypothetical protein